MTLSLLHVVVNWQVFTNDYQLHGVASLSGDLLYQWEIHRYRIDNPQ